MLIDNQEALKSWLMSILKKMSEADPFTLAKYVIALVKKDKPIEDLKESMLQQMEVFLQSETKGFVDMLFHTLDTKGYLQPITESSPKAAPQPSAAGPDQVEGKPDSTTTGIAPKASPEAVGKDGDQPKRKAAEDDIKGNGRALKRASPGRDRRHGGDAQVSPSRRHRRSPLRRFRSRSPTYRRNSSPHRRRRGSPYRRSRSRSYSPPPIAARKFDEESSGYTPTLSGSASAEKRVRCRDYDEKGYCLRGDQCKFDHGQDALVLEDSNVSYPRTTTVPPPYTEPYVPVPTFNLPPLHIPPPGYSGRMAKRSMESEQMSYPPAKRFDYQRLGIRGRGRGRGRGRSSLHPGGLGPLGKHETAQVTVRNIPLAMNTISNLNNHFSNFGTLVNVQVQFEGDPGSALVTYSSAEEAQSAVSSTDAIMGNRFIKVYFHRESMALNSVEHAKSDALLSGQSDAALAAAKAAKEDQKMAEVQAIKKNQEVLQAKAKIMKLSEEKKKEVSQKAVELRKGKQELLDKLLEEQKNLILKMEQKKATLKPEEKTSIMSLIKKLDESIEQAKEELQQIIQSTRRRRTVSDVQKDLLDVELEMFRTQQQGGDVSEVKKRMSMLKIEAAKLGVLPTSKSPVKAGTRGASSSPFFTPRGIVGGRFFRGSRGRGRGTHITASLGLTSVDRRPCKILVSGYEPEEKDSVVEHFKKFGEILETLDEDSTPSLIVHYKTRRCAEAAMSGGKSYADRLLHLSWYTGSTPSDFHNELSQISDADDTSKDLQDEYTSFDPAYLPPGLTEEESIGGHKRDSLSGDDKTLLQEDQDNLLDGGDEEEDDDEEEEEEEEEDNERSWKR